MTSTQHKVKKADVSHSGTVILQRLRIPLKSLNIQLWDTNPEVQFSDMKKKADIPIFKEHYANHKYDYLSIFLILKYNKQKAYLEYEVTSTVNTLFVIWLQHTVLWINNGFYHDCACHHVKHWDKSLPVPERAFWLCGCCCIRNHCY